MRGGSHLGSLVAGRDGSGRGPHNELLDGRSVHALSVEGGGQTVGGQPAPHTAMLTDKPLQGLRWGEGGGE